MSKVFYREKGQVYNNFSGEFYESKIVDKRATFNLLRNSLYNKKKQTPVQEYISNAVDIMLRCGKSPSDIEIYMPDLADRILKIRDYGTGLSKEDLQEFYFNFANSTKVKDKNQLGTWGYGSKSASAYTDDYFIVSYFNGHECFYKSKITDLGDFGFELIHEGETTEANGIEVQIPIKEKDVFDFVRAVYRTLIFAKDMPKIYTDNQELYAKIMKFREEIDFNNGNYFRVASNGDIVNILGLNSRCFININGIVYDVPNDIRFKEKYSKLFESGKYLISLNFNYNDLFIPPSRENVGENEANIEKICQKIDFAMSKIAKDLEDQILNNNETMTLQSIKDTLLFSKNCLNIEICKGFVFKQNGIEYFCDNGVYFNLKGKILKACDYDKKNLKEIEKIQFDETFRDLVYIKKYNNYSKGLVTSNYGKKEKVFFTMDENASIGAKFHATKLNFIKKDTKLKGINVKLFVLNNNELQYVNFDLNEALNDGLIYLKTGDSRIAEYLVREKNKKVFCEKNKKVSKKNENFIKKMFEDDISYLMKCFSDEEIQEIVEYKIKNSSLIIKFLIEMNSLGLKIPKEINDILEPYKNIKKVSEGKERVYDVLKNIYPEKFKYDTGNKIDEKFLSFFEENKFYFKLLENYYSIKYAISKEDIVKHWNVFLMNKN